MRNTVLGASLCLLRLLSGCAEQPVPAVETESPQQQQAAAVQEKEVWQVIYVNDQRIGYARSQTQREGQGESQIVQQQSDSYLKLKRFGQDLNLETHLQTKETPGGKLLSYTFEMQNPPAGATVSEGEIRDGTLQIKTKVANQVKQSQLKWESTFHSPSYIEQFFQQHPMQPGDEQSFSMLLPEYNKVTRVDLKAREYKQTELYGGAQAECLHVEMNQSLLPGMTIDLYVTREGKIPKTVADFLGSAMITYTVSKEVALEALSGKELDLAVQTLIKVKPIPGAHQTEKVVYEITLADGDPTSVLPESETQEVKKLDAHRARLTVRKAAVPQAFPEAKVDAEYLQPTQFLQSDDPRVIEHAKQAVQSETNPWKQAVLMEKYVREHLRKKNFSTALASAAEVAKNMEGDCTEHAVLLAAMLRAMKLPSRVAVGLVYIQSRASFGGHMWTEVYLDGRWIPLDATLGQGGIGAGHIKLADSSLSENAPAPLAIFLPILQAVGKLSIEVVETTPGTTR
ncbi:transglutaminase-like domain-containing protein [Gimesia panareensis]|uniref:transglutaminase-like domain-containing protein n=1 Tax=Gimesia panareensis TaxID=2527978 RepID=UPI00118B5599|nr:transglutaminase family protein [Gimesia panareensis]QDU53289.1 Transglutaminase-like superfamily protein [Gimesia panareensis]